MQKTIWITGASSGIGREFARRYAAMGCRLAQHDGKGPHRCYDLALSDAGYKYADRDAGSSHKEKCQEAGIGFL